MVRHFGQEAGSAAITTKHATAAGMGKERLIDGRSALLCQFAASQPDHDVEFDLNALTDRGVDDLLIPPGHNLGGVACQVFTGATSPASTFRASATPTASTDWVIVTAIGSLGDRYLRLKFNATGQWHLGEVWFGRKETPARGVAQGWELSREVPVEVVEFPTREVVSVLGGSRRVVSLTYADVEDGLGDWVILQQIAALGRSAPFVFFPPQSSGVPFLARLLEDVSIEQDSPVPAVKLGYRFRLRLREQTT
jgi:hypothetical protein